MSVADRRAHLLSLAGSGGLTVANQIYNRFKSAGKALNPGDIAIVDAAEYHYYQVRMHVAYVAPQHSHVHVHLPVIPRIARMVSIVAFETVPP